nr:MAG TPA: hypothetical protein [Caudoviricetes sp.]
MAEDVKVDSIKLIMLFGLLLQRPSLMNGLAVLENSWYREVLLSAV